MSEVKVEQVDWDLLKAFTGGLFEFKPKAEADRLELIAAFRIEATRTLSAEVEALREFYQAVHDMTCVWADTDRPSSICPHRRDEAEDDDEEDLWDNFVATRARVKALLNKEPAR